MARGAGPTAPWRDDASSRSSAATYGLAGAGGRLFPREITNPMKSSESPHLHHEFPPVEPNDRRVEVELLRIHDRDHETHGQFDHGAPDSSGPAIAPGVVPACEPCGVLEYEPRSRDHEEVPAGCEEELGRGEARDDVVEVGHFCPPFQSTASSSSVPMSRVNGAPHAANVWYYPMPATTRSRLNDGASVSTSAPAANAGVLPRSTSTSRAPRSTRHRRKCPILVHLWMSRWAFPEKRRTAIL